MTEILAVASWGVATILIAIIIRKGNMEPVIAWLWVAIFAAAIWPAIRAFA